MNEVRKTVVAGGQQFVDAAGDFIFCSFADRPFRIIIDGQPVTVRVGDKLRPEKRFRNFQIENLDPENAMTVTLVVGEGDYNSQIIQGEVTVNSGVRGADGVWKDDTRHTITMDVFPRRATAKAYPQETAVYQGPPLVDSVDYGSFSIDELGLMVAPMGNGFAHLVRWMRTNDGPEPNQTVFQLRVYSRKMELIYQQVVSDPGSIYDMAHHNGEWYLACNKNFPGNGHGLDKGLGVITRVWDNPYNVQLASVASTPLGLLIIDGDSNYFLMDSDGVVTEISKPDWFNPAGSWENNLKARWDYVTNTGYFTDTSAGLKVWTGNFEFVRDIDLGDRSTGELYDGFAPLGRFYAVMGPGSVYGSEVQEGRAAIFAFEEFTTPGQIQTIKPRCNGLSFLADSYEDTFITADVVMTPTAGGVVITGEVIRAALEQYFGRPVADGYMDHVYRFEVAGDLVGAQAIIREGGSRSLQARSVKDDLSVTVPSQMSITIDDDLPFA